MEPTQDILSLFLLVFLSLLAVLLALASVAKRFGIMVPEAGVLLAGGAVAGCVMLLVDDDDGGNTSGIRQHLELNASVFMNAMLPPIIFQSYQGLQPYF